MKPAVLMMFRDEADILHDCLERWVELGVRNFYLIDNRSADQSRIVADAFIAWESQLDPEFYAYIELECATDWPGRRVINSLKEKAINDGCNFIFPADADEFLEIPKGMTIHDWIECLNATSGWAEMPYLDILPDGRMKWNEPQRKAIGFITKEMTISMGNHLIEGVEPTIKAHGAYYRHRPLRSYPQFKKKMENYMTAFNQTAFQDHPHAVDFHKWKAEGEDFLKRRWEELTGLKAE